MRHILLLTIILFTNSALADCEPPFIASQDLAYKSGDINKTIALQLDVSGDCPEFVASKAVVVPPTLTDVVVINFERTLNGDTTSLNVYASAEMNEGNYVRGAGFVFGNGQIEQQENSITLQASDDSDWGSQVTFNSVPGLIVLEKMVFTKLN